MGGRWRSFTTRGSGRSTSPPPARSTSCSPRSSPPAPVKLARLAEIVRDMADHDDGGHLHVEHHPDHWYLAEGSVAVILASPHGGMPRR
ncbi:Imm32 family immunity protein [Micromonospora sp. CPCC 205556]|uniref:Imm32 family immunity protein n=1 Tax=Micromonospora sp. CPCC 205556 TaxID=3122398 RepID=UPI003FA5BA3B